MVEDLQIKKDLDDYADDSVTFDNPRSRTDVIREILPDSADVQVYTEGHYQGSMGFVICLDGYYWLIKEYYGSCSYCDGFLGTDDATEYGMSILRNAYCLESHEDAVEFVEKIDKMGWYRIRDGLLEILEGGEEDE